MAVTASVALSSSTTTTQKPIVITLTVTNGNAADVTVQSIEPVAVPTNSQSQHTVSCAMGQPLLISGYNTTVSAGSSSTFSWSFNPFEPLTSADILGGATTEDFTVGCYVNTSDGTRNSAGATVTVTPRI